MVDRLATRPPARSHLVELSSTGDHELPLSHLDSITRLGGRQRTSVRRDARVLLVICRKGSSYVLFSFYSAWQA